EPRADRPSMNEAYFGEAPLAWSWAEDQLADARNYWISTIALNGRPHVRPVWGVWLDNTVQFTTGGRHVENIARDPRVTVNLESGEECVIIEGVAETTTDEARHQAFIEVYEPKYDWPMTLDFVDVLYVVQPKVIFGWIAYDIAPQATLYGA